MVGNEQLLALVERSLIFHSFNFFVVAVFGLFGEGGLNMINYLNYVPSWKEKQSYLVRHQDTLQWTCSFPLKFPVE